MLKEMYNEKERNVYSLHPCIHKSDLIAAILMLLVELMGPVLICWGRGNP